MTGSWLPTGCSLSVEVDGTTVRLHAHHPAFGGEPMVSVPCSSASGVAKGYVALCALAHAGLRLMTSRSDGERADLALFDRGRR